jgi:hypothetical protein
MHPVNEHGFVMIHVEHRVSDVLSGLIHCDGVVIDTQSDVSPSRQMMAMLANGLIRQATTCHQHAR